MFSDVVGSTELSGRQEPEAYRELMRAYRVACRDVIESRFEGHIVQLKGDGTLSVFGFPVAHENDAERAVRAGLALVRALHDLSVDTTGRAAGESLEVRVAVHHGPVYVDFDEDDIYGLAANVAARLHSVAAPGTVVVSDEVRQLVGDHFEIESGDPQVVKGVAEPIEPFRVVRERRFPVQRSWSTPLVERESELQRLRELWTRVTAGAADGPAAMLVRGDAGVGKSRLVAALAEEVRAGNGAVVELHGSPFHADAGLHPVRQLVEARCGISDDADPAERLAYLAGEVTNLGLDPSEAVPLLAPVLGISSTAGYDQAAAEGRKLEEQILRAALAYMVACTAGRPAIVVAENLHWFDDATCDLLAELTRAGPRSLLVVATSRSREEGRWETIELSPLTLAGRFTLIDALVADMSEQDRLALATRSDGIPLYLEELVRARRIGSAPTAGDPAPRPALYPECSTNRSSPGSTPHRPHCRSPPLQPPPVRRSSARSSKRRRRSRPRSSTPLSETWSTHGSCSRSRVARTGTGSGTSFCARSHTSCSPPRGGGRSTAGSVTFSRATSPVIGASLRRTSSERSAITRPRRRTSRQPNWLAAGAPWRKLVPISPGQSTWSCPCRRTRHATTVRSSYASDEAFLR